MKMTEQNKQDINHENGLSDLEPIANVKGGNTTWTGSVTLNANTAVGVTYTSRESTLTYSGESGGINE
ncbi:MAG: hypothetical protein AB1757_24365 [Acidobacteriota bacterium]